MAEFVFRYGTKVKSITSYDAWKSAFETFDSPKHWRDGRSAQSLANDFMRGDCAGRDIIFQLVEQISGQKIVGGIDACIEHESRFDKFGGKGRMQDLAVYGSLVDGQKFFVGVEAKVDETFDATISDKATYIIEKVLRPTPNSKQPKRMENLIKDFLHIEMEFPFIPKDIKDLRYQLLYYLAGSFREDADIIYMPVMVYKTNGEKHGLYKQEVARENHSDYKRFIERLGFKDYKTIQLAGNDVMVYFAQIEDNNDYRKKPVYTCYIER